MILSPELLELATTASALESGFVPAGRDTTVLRRAAGYVEKRRSKSYGARRWTAKEIAYLKENHGYLPVSEMAEALHRTPTAVRQHCLAMGFPVSRKRSDVMTARDMARAIGTYQQVIAKLIHEGVWPGHATPGNRAPYLCRRRDFMRWVINPMNWPHIHASVKDTGRIRDRKLRRLIELRKERWGDEWMGTQEIAEHCGYAASATVARLLSSGTIPAVMSGYVWYARRSDIDAWNWSPGRGRAAVIPWSEELDNFVVLARALSLSWATISHLTNQPQSGRLAYHVRWLGKSGELESVLKRLPGVVQVNGRLYADWRDHTDRFPGIARAVARFKDGRKLSEAQRIYLRAVFCAALVRAGKSNSRHRAARSLRHRGGFTDDGLREIYQQLLEWGIDPLGGES